MQKFRIKTPAQNAAQALTHQQMMQQQQQQQQMQNAMLQGGQYDPNIHGHLTNTGFRAAEIKQEGMRISNGGTGFWGGITKSLGGR